MNRKEKIAEIKYELDYINNKHVNLKNKADVIRLVNLLKTLVDFLLDKSVDGGRDYTLLKKTSILKLIELSEHDIMKHHCLEQLERLGYKKCQIVECIEVISKNSDTYCYYHKKQHI